MIESVRQRYQVTVLRQALEEATFYLSAESEEAAEMAADLFVSDGLITEWAVNESQYEYYIDPIDPKHDVEPTSGEMPGSSVCLVCDEPVEWTGASADDPTNTTGTTVPGPWRHAHRASLESGARRNGCS